MHTTPGRACNLRPRPLLTVTVDSALAAEIQVARQLRAEGRRPWGLSDLESRRRLCDKTRSGVEVQVDSDGAVTAELARAAT